MATDPLFMKIGADYYFYHNDHIGTPQKMTSVSGAVVWSGKYSSFGKVTVDASSAIVNPLRFPGQYEDVETGLHYNLHRTYHIEIGRYLTLDPIGVRGGINLFVYAYDNPANLIDPFGLQSLVIPGLPPIPIIKTPEQLDADKKIADAIWDFITGDDDVVDEELEEYCRQEKEGCIEMCSDIAENNDCDREKVWGGSMSQCIKNCLPEVCGGEPKWKGY